MPKISVLMSAHNAEKYIREAIESILNQTLRDLEFIIIDDNSGDSTLKIIKEYNDARIKIIENKTNLGLTKSLNLGLKMAQGEYIARIDADDVSTNTRLEEEFKFMNQFPDVAVIGSWAEIINEKSEKVFVEQRECDVDIIKWTQILKNQIIHSSAFFRKNILSDIGSYNEKYQYAQDFEFWFRVSRKYKMINIPKLLVEQRVHQKSITQAPKTANSQKSLIVDIIAENINYYLNLKPEEIKLFFNAFKCGRIVSFKNLMAVRKIYQNLFDAYIRKEKLGSVGIKKIRKIYKKNKRFTIIWYLKSIFEK